MQLIATLFVRYDTGGARVADAELDESAAVGESRRALVRLRTINVIKRWLICLSSKLYP